MLLLAGCTEQAPRQDPPAPAVTEVGALAFSGPLPRHLLMLSIDTLRRDHFDPHDPDGGAPRMPFLAARMAEGVLAADHQQCSDWTLASMTCTLLGRPSEELGFVPRLDGHGAPLPDGLRTLAVRLREVGRHPLVASSNGYFGPDWNSVQGYGPDLAAGTGALGVGEDGLAGLQDEIAANAELPWFLHVHVKEPHAPYVPPEEWLADEAALPPVAFDLATSEGLAALSEAWPTLAPEDQALAGQHLEARYTGEIRWLDDQLATLWGELEAEGVLDDALVVVWSDHGEGMFERGLRGHANLLYREENDGVLGFWAKNLRPAVWTGPTHAIDVVPTVLAVLGIDLGEPLPGAVIGTAPDDRARFASTVAFQGPFLSATVAGQKLLYGFDGTLERYDLANDPGEQVNLYEPDDPVSASLWEVLLPRVEELAALIPEHVPVLPP